MAHVIVFALTIQFQIVVVLRFGGGAVADVARGLHRSACQPLAPNVEATNAEAAAQPLFNRNLQPVVICCLAVW